jgi:hypothetical protein
MAAANDFIKETGKEKANNDDEYRLSTWKCKNLASLPRILEEVEEVTAAE